jgi:hypothetical protein
MMMAASELEVEEAANGKELMDDKVDWKTRTAASLLRRRQFLEKRQAAKHATTTTDRGTTKNNVRRRPLLHTVGTALQKINVGKWIKDLESEHGVAEQLEELNDRNLAEHREAARRRAKREEAEKSALRDHLISFLKEYPQVRWV